MALQTTRLSRMFAFSLTSIASRLAPTGEVLALSPPHIQRICLHAFVGASLLAMVLQATRLSRMFAFSLTSIASKLAPTGAVLAQSPTHIQRICLHARQISRNRVCRSELARDGVTGDAFIQNVRVFVDVHREQARSYTAPEQRPRLNH